MQTMCAMTWRVTVVLGWVLSISACQAQTTDSAPLPTASAAKVASEALTWQDVVTLDEPWAMAVLPDNTLLVTQKSGQLKWIQPQSQRISDVGGVPEVEYSGQGGLGDVALHPDFANNQWVYLSYAEPEDGRVQGAAVMRAKLQWQNQQAQLTEPQVVWRQYPKVTGHGHYGHRLVFGPDGKLWISSSERQKFQPAQDMQSNLGKIVRLNDDGSIPDDNPFASQGGVSAQIWSLGHRNVLGMAFDAQGRLWANEMGPKGGDEFNLIEKGGNYGYPVVSDGDHYSGRVIPNHDTQPQFIAPQIVWTPVISPSSLMIYQGSQFPQWQGQALMGGLSSKALIRVRIDQDRAQEVARYDMKERIRAVAQGQNGEIWVLEDGQNARLRQLLPL